MILQSIILLYILFSFYSLSFWLSNLFRRKDVSEKIVFSLFTPLLFSLYFFYVLVAFGGNAFLISLFPLVLFSTSYLILPAILLALISPYLTILILPYYFYLTFRSYGRKFTYIKPLMISFLVPVLAVLSIGFGSYLIYLLPFSLFSFLLASIFVPIVDLKFERIDISNISLLSLSFMLPLANIFKKISFDRNLLVVAILLSLIPLVRELYIYSRRKNKRKF